MCTRNWAEFHVVSSWILVIVLHKNSHFCPPILHFLFLSEFLKVNYSKQNFTRQKGMRCGTCLDISGSGFNPCCQFFSFPWKNFHCFVFVVNSKLDADLVCYCSCESRFPCTCWFWKLWKRWKRWRLPERTKSVDRLTKNIFLTHFSSEFRKCSTAARWILRKLLRFFCFEKSQHFYKNISILQDKSELKLV